MKLRTMQVSRSLKRIEDEVKECTFSPRINYKSNKLSRSASHLDASANYSYFSPSPSQVSVHNNEKSKMKSTGLSKFLGNTQRISQF